MSNGERKTFYQIVAVLSGLFMVANFLNTEAYSVGVGLGSFIFGFALGKLDAVYGDDRR